LKWRCNCGGPVRSSPAVSADGIIYVGSDDDNVYAINGTAGLANSPWPMFHRDLLHTGRAQ
jgi:outer membrane protein assembly factor BamB